MCTKIQDLKYYLKKDKCNWSKIRPKIIIENKSGAVVMYTETGRIPSAVFDYVYRVSYIFDVKIEIIIYKGKPAFFIT